MGWRSTVLESRYNFDTEQDFVSFYSSNGFYETLDRTGISPWLYLPMLGGASYCAGFLISLISGNGFGFLRYDFPKLFSIGLMISLGGILWADRNGKDIVIDIRPVFDVDDARYYGLFGKMVELFYKPLPWVESRRKIHRPTGVAFGLNFAAVFYIYFFTPARLTALSGDPWGEISHAIQLYHVLLFLIVILVLTYILWVLVIGLLFLGFQLSSFPVRLDVTQRDFGIGLEVYSRYLLKVGGIYLIAWTVIGLHIVNVPSMTTMFIYGFISLLPVCGIIGGHYGMYRAIKSTKSRKLEQFSRSHDTNIGEWVGEEATIPDETPTEFLAFVEAKREIERLPNWPLNVGVIVEILILVVASNLSVLLRLVIMAP